MPGNRISSVNPEQAMELLKTHAVNLKNKKNIDVKTLQQVGVGTRGVAFKCGDKVLKVTADESEAKTSMCLVGKSEKNIVHIFDVFRFKDTNVFGILQEQLTPIGDDEIKEINNALVTSRFPVFYARNDYDWEKAKAATVKYIIKIAHEKFPDDEDEQKKWVMDLWGLMTRKYNIKSIAEQVTALGIKFHDFHGGNLMRRNNGTLVLVDLGMSRVTGPVRDPEVLETLKRAIRKLIKEMLMR